MLTSFLFINAHDLNDILSMRLDRNGRVDAGLKRRTPAEIRALQATCRTVVVIPSEWTALFNLELSWLAERKAREAIPFALEDNLAQPVSQVHFAFDRHYYQNNRYLVLGIDKRLIEHWMTHLKNREIHYDAITTDWFALSAGEACVLDQRVLVHAPQFKGALDSDSWESQSHHWAEDLTWHAEVSYEWLAERLLQQPLLNICQGALQHDSGFTPVKRWYQWSGILVASWLLCFILTHTLFLGLIGHRNAALDQQIMASYRVFFPEARQVISPKIRIMQLFKKTQTGYNAVLWSLMEKISTVLVQKNTPQAVTLLQELQFQNDVLTLTLVCNGFALLEKIESDLRREHVHVHQLSAANESQQVVAKLELSL